MALSRNETIQGLETKLTKARMEKARFDIEVLEMALDFILLPIEQIQRHVSAAYPAATMTMTLPLYHNGVHHLDIDFKKKMIVVEWSLEINFWITELTETGLIFDGPDTRVTTLEAAIQYVDKLLTS